MEQRSLVKMVLNMIETPPLVDIIQLEKEENINFQFSFIIPSYLPLYSPIAMKLEAIYQSVLLSLQEVNRSHEAIFNRFVDSVNKDNIKAVIDYIDQHQPLKIQFEKVLYFFSIKTHICTGFYYTQVPYAQSQVSFTRCMYCCNEMFGFLSNE